MSIKIVSRVLTGYHCDNPSEKLVAVVLADFASEHGLRIWPSVATIAHRSGLTERSVQRILSAMRASGWLVAIELNRGGSQRTNHYRISPDWLAAKDCQGGDTQGKGGDAHVTHGGDAHVTQSVSKNRHKNPSRDNPLPPDDLFSADPADPPAGPKIEEPAASIRTDAADATSGLPDGAPAGLSADDWTAFVRHRAEIKRPLTGESVKRTIKDLARLAAEGHDPAAVIDQSIRMSWRGLFPVHSQHSTTTPQPMSARMRARMEVADAIAQYREPAGTVSRRARSREEVAAALRQPFDFIDQ